MYETHAGATLVRTGYGDLEKIIALRVPAALFFGPLREKTILVALVKPWDMDGKVASKSSVFFKTSKARIIMDLRSLKVVVGLVKTRGKWGICHDRMTPHDSARPLVCYRLKSDHDRTPPTLRIHLCSDN